MPAGWFSTSSLVLGDVDRDDDLDLVVGNGGYRSAEQSRLYLNLQRQLDAPFVLHVGRSYQLDAYARYGPASVFDAAVPFLATATANIPLPPFGTLGLDPRSMLALPPFLIPQPSGVGSLAIQVPNDRALGGLGVHTQALIVHYPLLERLTNVNTDIVLR